MVKMVNFILCIFYHNKNSITVPVTIISIIKEYIRGYYQKYKIYSLKITNIADSN